LAYKETDYQHLGLPNSHVLPPLFPTTPQNPVDAESLYLTRLLVQLNPQVYGAGFTGDSVTPFWPPATATVRGYRVVQGVVGNLIAAPPGLLQDPRQGVVNSAA